MTVLINSTMIWPSLLMGAVIPCFVLFALFFSKKRKQTNFTAALYGFGTFFVSLAAVALLVLIISRIFLPSITISSESDADAYIYVGGGIVLLLFYLVSEALKLISFDTVLRSEKQEFAGLTFGSGFILAQNLLIIGLIFAGEVDISQSIAFGLLMLISGIIYILISTVGYQFAVEKQKFAGSAVAFAYFLLFAVMLIFSNVYITYGFIGAVLLFVLIVAYVVLPLPFKKQKGADQ